MIKPLNSDMNTTGPNRHKIEKIVLPTIVSNRPGLKNFNQNSSINSDYSTINHLQKLQTIDTPITGGYYQNQIQSQHLIGHTPSDHLRIQDSSLLGGRTYQTLDGPYQTGGSFGQKP